MATIRTSYEAARGCGFRKAGGLYLVAGSEGEPCGRLPIDLRVCPCCGQGIKPARSWTWIEPRQLITGTLCRTMQADPQSCAGRCILSDLRCPERAGLLWIGGKFYPTPAAFSGEAARMGVSRRITAVPRGFVVGETWVLLAHREVLNRNGDRVPAIFSAFLPTAIEYIVKGTETDEELDKLEARGLTLVDVKPLQAPLEAVPDEPDDGDPWTCPRCGAEVEPGAPRCGDCGSDPDGAPPDQLDRDPLPN